MSRAKVTVEGRGRSGDVVYEEGTNVARFYFEFGGEDDLLFIISLPRPDRWDEQLPWAKGRRDEIVSYVGAEVVRREARGYHAEIDEADSAILIRKAR
jgi:hypothetical protein